MATRGDTAGPSHHRSPPWGVSPSEEEASTTLPSRAGAGPCAAGEVPCDSGSCINAELACDFAETCADGSDEKRCGESHGQAAGSSGARRQRGLGQGDSRTPWLARPGEVGARAVPGPCAGPAGLSLGFCRSNHLRGGGRGLA